MYQFMPFPQKVFLFQNMNFKLSRLPTSDIDHIVQSGFSGSEFSDNL